MKRLFQAILISIVSGYSLPAVAQLCRADFTFENTGNSFTIRFYDLSKYAKPAFWDFGDGKGVKDVDNPEHLYASPGKYEVCLYVHDSTTNCVDDTCIVIVIPNNYKACKAVFAIDSINVREFQFNDHSIFPSKDTSRFLWHWDFGDGQTSATQNPLHIYAEGGVFKVCLTIIDTVTDCSDDTCMSVYALNCEADFSYEADSTGSGFQFNGNFSDEYNPTQFKWYFGDGDSSDMAEPFHEYQSVGVYNVCLYVKNDNICRDTVCHTVKVSGINKCAADFNFYVSKKNVQFIASYAKGPKIGYSWDFGDGVISKDSNPDHQYDHAGIYQVCFSIYDTLLNCYDTVCKIVAIDKENVTVDKGINGRFSTINPKPASHQAELVFDIGKDEIYDFIVYDVLGKRLQSFPDLHTEKFPFSVANLAQGMYYYQVVLKHIVVSKGNFMVQ